MPDGGVLDIRFQPKQWLAYTSPATELLYGGAAFGGKSHLVRIAAILWCLDIPGLQVYVFRRVEEDLLKNHMEGPQGFENLLAPYVASGHCKVIQSEIAFANGSRIYMCHCKDEAHRFKYHGAEIHVLIIDELTTFTEIIYRYLRFRVRAVGLKSRGAIPAKYLEGNVGPNGEVNTHDLFPRILCSTNPGNIGHHWVKRTFVDHGPMKLWRTLDSEGGMWRQYIGARLEDNRIGLRDDPTYVQRMRGLGDEMLVRAMEKGDWNIIAGGFFPEFSLERHVLKAVTLDWKVFTRRFAGVDWGSAKPFSVGWYAIADEDVKLEGTLGNAIVVPRGSIVRYREWYGCAQRPDGSFIDNTGVKMTIEAWTKGVLERSPETLLYCVADTSMWDEDGGPSLAETAMNVRHKGRQLLLRRADKRRITGWNQMRGRLKGDYIDGSGPPFFFCMDNQQHFIRTIQSVQHDELKPEDLDTDAEDHAVDEVRYACMSRPRAAANQTPPPKRGPKPWTFDWIVQQGRGPSTYSMQEESE